MNQESLSNLMIPNTHHDMTDLLDLEVVPCDFL